MFNRKSWAAAFINSVEKSGGDGDITDASGALTALAAFGASWAASQRHVSFGEIAARKLEPALRKAFLSTSGAGNAGTAGAVAVANGKVNAGELPFTEEIALRFFLLMVKKNAVLHIDSAIDEIRNIMDKKRGIIKVTAEYAFPPEKEFESMLSETIKKRAGASGIELTGLVNAELIGGYRLRIGDEIIDASVRGQLRKMETCLASGFYHPGGDGVN